ncbi:helix-turn-helix domain-containing protein [Gordonia soli]|uniref:Helix-turn-helix domain-containing protein n=1 Tax=Gordonia soli NBRC 108243 TaxID=1223545 RepID=M0QQD4_9ACTN|nr:helix-turn-helix domain-containing protein [Gordonia soli]GAC70793.1 hypothetical protein GS4_41_00400 [Gordonia soli NBRC 108243]
MPNRHASHDPEELLTFPEVAQLLKVSLRTVQRYAKSEAIEVVRLPGAGVRIRRSAVDAALSGTKASA